MQFLADQYVEIKRPCLTTINKSICPEKTVLRRKYYQIVKYCSTRKYIIEPNSYKKVEINSLKIHIFDMRIKMDQEECNLWLYE